MQPFLSFESLSVFKAQNDLLYISQQEFTNTVQNIESLLSLIDTDELSMKLEQLRAALSQLQKDAEACLASVQAATA